MKALVLTILGALIAVFALLYIILYTPPVEDDVVDDSATTTAPAVATTSEQILTGEGTLRSLLQQAMSLECSISYEPTAALGNSTPVTGTYFVANNRLRGDFIATVDGELVVSSMIMDGSDLFTWSEVLGERYGMRIDLTTVTPGAADQPATREPVPLDEPVTYECRTWSLVDATIFVPPQDIVWQDYSALIKQGIEAPVLYETPN